MKDITIYKISDRVHDYYKRNASNQRNISKYVLAKKISALIANHTYKQDTDGLAIVYYFGQFYMMVDRNTDEVFWIGWNKHITRIVPPYKSYSLIQTYKELGLNSKGTKYKIPVVD